MIRAAAGGMPALRGRLRNEQPLARYTTWRIGGPAQRIYEPADRDDLAVFLATLPADEPLFWIGRGSNLLVRDGGLRGTVLVTAGALTRIERIDEMTLEVEAGVACARVARVAARDGLSGAEFLAGIPGTMGGALVMNAGAHGGETWGIVRGVRVIDRAGRMHTRAAADFTIGYRQARGRADEWFIAATLCLRPADPEQCLARIREHLTRRAAAQPIGKPSCGSVFRNPPGDHAGRLIEAVGLKGAREGGCHVSTRHANFIINDGGATARDVERLMQRIQNAVRETTGVELQPEVRIVGDPEPAAVNETNRESDDGR